MHVVRNILFQEFQKLHLFEILGSLIFALFSTICGTAVEENEKTLADRN